MFLHSKDIHVRSCKPEEKGMAASLFYDKVPMSHICAVPPLGSSFFRKITNCYRPVTIVYLTDGCVLENLQWGSYIISNFEGFVRKLTLKRSNA